MILKLIKWCMPFILLLLSNALLGMEKLYLHKKEIATLGILTAAAYVADCYDAREMIEVSSPATPKKVSNLLAHYKEKKIVASVTKDQINHDSVLSLATPSDRSILSRAQINRLSLAESWVVMPKMRKELNNLTEYVCHEEGVYKEQDYFCCVHGTHKGASMLLRTIFDEVLHDAPKEHFVQIRDVQKAKNKIQQANAQEYYDDRYKKAPRVKEMRVILYGNPVPTGNEMVYMDLTDNREELLSVNAGLYGNTSWINNPRKESSIEFIAKPCSWAYQTADVSLNVVGLLMSQVMVLPKIVSALIKNPSDVVYLPMLFDTLAKDVDTTIIQQIFKDYGAEDLYEKYKAELHDYEKQASAGLLQMMIPRKKAEQWCYVSQMLGVKAGDYSVMELQEQYKELLPYVQSRVVLHSDIIEYDTVNKDKNTVMNFYLLMDPKGLSAMTHRMYEIAQEVKKRSVQ